MNSSPINPSLTSSSSQPVVGSKNRYNKINKIQKNTQDVANQLKKYLSNYIVVELKNIFTTLTTDFNQQQPVKSLLRTNSEVKRFLNIPNNTQPAKLSVKSESGTNNNSKINQQITAFIKGNFNEQDSPYQTPIAWILHAEDKKKQYEALKQQLKALQDKVDEEALTLLQSQNNANATAKQGQLASVKEKLDKIKESFENNKTLKKDSIAGLNQISDNNLSESQKLVNTLIQGLKNFVQPPTLSDDDKEIIKKQPIKYLQDVVVRSIQQLKDLQGDAYNNLYSFMGLKAANFGTNGKVNYQAVAPYFLAHLGNVAQSNQSAVRNKLIEPITDILNKTITIKEVNDLINNPILQDVSSENITVLQGIILLYTYPREQLKSDNINSFTTNFFAQDNNKFIFQIKNPTNGPIEEQYKHLYLPNGKTIFTYMDSLGQQQLDNDKKTNVINYLKVLCPSAFDGNTNMPVIQDIVIQLEQSA